MAKLKQMLGFKTLAIRQQRDERWKTQAASPAIVSPSYFERVSRVQCKEGILVSWGCHKKALQIG
jgi:hypothetical protein